MKFLIICPTNPFPPPTLPSASLSPTAKFVPPSQPQIHHRNWAERDIQTFKNHFISGLCSTHPDFPLNLWDKLLPQATLTLNLLRPSPINPKLSAYAQIHGAFNFDKTPLAPPGIKVHTHERAEGRKTFAVHSARGYYIGPCLHHYRCYNVWIPTTNSIRIANTVDWFPHNLTMPTSSPTDILLATAKDLTAALRQSQRNPLLPPPDTKTRQALVQLDEIFSNVTKPTITTIAAFPRVPNVKIPTHAALPRKPLTTTNDYLTMTATNRHLRRQNQHPSKKAPPATLPVSSLPHLESNKSAFTAVQLPPKLRQLVNTEIQRASDPTVNLFYKLNAVLNADNGKLEEYRHLLKGKDKTL
jgi:hypothetical protein